MGGRKRFYNILVIVLKPLFLFRINVISICNISAISIGNFFFNLQNLSHVYG
jgi:hypothetical protein